MSSFLFRSYLGRQGGDTLWVLFVTFLEDTISQQIPCSRDSYNISVPTSTKSLSLRWRIYKAKDSFTQLWCFQTTMTRMALKPEGWNSGIHSLAADNSSHWIYDSLIKKEIMPSTRNIANCPGTVNSWILNENRKLPLY